VPDGLGALTVDRCGGGLSRRLARIADARVAAELKVEPPQILCAAANDNRDVSDARIS
jgi:hypothetical protein